MKRAQCPLASPELANFQSSTARRHPILPLPPSWTWSSLPASYRRSSELPQCALISLMRRTERVNTGAFLRRLAPWARARLCLCLCPCPVCHKQHRQWFWTQTAAARLPWEYSWPGSAGENPQTFACSQQRKGSPPPNPCLQIALFPQRTPSRLPGDFSGAG